VDGSRLLSLTYSKLVDAVKVARSNSGPLDEKFFDENRAATDTLLRAMSRPVRGSAASWPRLAIVFFATPHTERGSIFSTASAQPTSLQSMPLRDISRPLHFGLSCLRSDRPTTIMLCLPLAAWKVITLACA